MSVHPSSVRIDRSLLSGPAHVRVQIRYGDGSAGELPGILRELGPGRIALVTGPGLPREHAARVLRLLGAAAPTGVLWPDGGGPLVVPDGALVVALGGTRVIAAAGRARCADGTRPALVRLPTTLRAMSDTALSVAGPGGRISAPILVRIQLEFLATLAPQALRAGLSPLLRTVLAVVPASAERVASRLRPGGGYDPGTLASFVSLCLEARAALACHDPLERGPAAALRYGDTVARALRSLAGPDLRHGDALALGLRAAAGVSRRSGLLDPADEAAHEDLLDRAGAARALPGGILPRELAAAVTGGRDQARMVLLRGPGDPYAHHGGLLTPVAADVLEAALAQLVPAGRRVPGPDRDRARIQVPGGRDSGRPTVDGPSAPLPRQ
ncbi:hypothetical protein [Streptomyces sp. NBC_00091]|uniref:3-dehydroquinate synthase family protein n=1 Tax=Streptomyces sp. NBC_00091 TaxID=2975648 RepID=UPI0022584192|nr:hypothetical protein [Streptomyces sp. NBC_00091]MCX5380590.1 hypothetical protein [Streptomyces sp. NBC_00091]